MMGLSPKQGNLRLFFRLFSLMRGLEFPCQGRSTAIDYFLPILFNKTEHLPNS